ncbi:MAG: hypothetical protein ACKVZ0_25355 [Gemmatimonadales bacterium]
MNQARLQALVRWVGVVGLGLAAGCGADREAVTSPSFAKGGGAGPSVAATDPSYGYEGEVAKQVTITGSGFSTGAAAGWERNGAPDPKIQVLSTQFVSSTKLVASITIAPGAAIDLYDVAVTNPDRKKGIGYKLFEVTQAIAIQGTVLAREANELGQIVGESNGGAFFWSAATGLESLAASGTGMDLSDDGLTVAGSLGTSDPATKVAVVWTRSGGSWTQTQLPRDPATSRSNPFGMASDPVTGAPVAIAGVDIYVTKRTVQRQPRLWLPVGGGWQRIVLPNPSVPQNDILAMDVSTGLVVVGNAGQRAAAWEPNGTGGWTPLVVGPPASDIRAINRAGTLAVGRNSQIASYWTRAAGVWAGPFTLPGACTNAYDVDDLGRIAMSGCPSGIPSKPNAAIISPPYGAGNILVLGGFGDLTTGPTLSGMSNLGTWIVGSSTIKNVATGAYWRAF